MSYVKSRFWSVVRFKGHEITSSIISWKTEDLRNAFMIGVMEGLDCCCNKDLANEIEILRYPEDVKEPIPFVEDFLKKAEEDNEENKDIRNKLDDEYDRHSQSRSKVRE